MEHRTELEELLLAGLPPAERQHVVEVIRLTSADVLRRLREKNADSDAMFTYFSDGDEAEASP